jgi:hypothetical protein
VQRGERERVAVPGDALLHPVPIAAIALLVINDHVLKAAFPGPLTGKLSDFAGLAFFPLLLVSAVEVAAAGLRRWRGPSRGLLVAAIIATGLAFAVVKAVPAGTVAYGAGLGLLQWPLRTAAAAMTGQPAPGVAPVDAATDPSDLVALPALALAWLIGSARLRQRPP